MKLSFGPLISLAALGATTLPATLPTTQPVVVPSAAVPTTQPIVATTRPVGPVEIPTSSIAGPSTASVIDARTLEADVRAVSERCVANTIGLVHRTGSGTSIGVASGSGVLVTADGLILTAGHVIEKPGTELYVRFADGRLYKGVALGIDHLTDTGVARITDPAPAGGWPFSPIAPAGSVRPGDWVLATGNPGSIVIGRDPPLRIGRVTTADDTVIQTNCALEPGDSGGPIYDLGGRVIGVNSRIAAGRAASATPEKEYLSLHTPITAFQMGWTGLMAGDNVHPDVTLGAPRRPNPGQNGRFRRALAKLAAAHDPEVMKMMADARNGGGRTPMTPQQMDQLIRRADALSTTRPTTQPATHPTSAPAGVIPVTTRPATTEPVVVASTQPTTAPTTAPTMAGKDRPMNDRSVNERPGIPLAMRPMMREQLRSSIKAQFPTAKITDAILEGILDRSHFDPATHALKLATNESDLKAMGLTDEAIVAVATGHGMKGRTATAWGKTALQTLSMFAPTVASAGDCVVEIRSEKGESLLLGTVVADDGWIATKASDLPDHPMVTLADGRSLPARVVGRDSATDLALLKVAAKGLNAVHFTFDGVPTGELVCCPMADPSQPAIGVVSVPTRPIALHAPAFMGEQKFMLGVRFTNDACKIAEVIVGMPAALAGVKADDMVTAIDGKAVSTTTDFIERMKGVQTGQQVALTVQRDGKPIDLKLVIGTGRSTTQTTDTVGNTDQYAGGKLSKRRTNFPQAIETDVAVWADQCGGPLLNLRGEAVGVTIARYDRVCTFVLPASLVRQTLDRLRTRTKM